MMNHLQFHEALNSFLSLSDLNRCGGAEEFSLYESSLMGIASAGDPLFESLKDEDVVGEHHLGPKEWFPEAKSVISYFLPFSEDVRISNRKEKDNPSLEWLYGRIEGEVLNNAVRKFLYEKIAAAGGRGFAPSLDPGFKIVNRRSNWSERHVAYIAGLGTFGLSKSLITPKGSAGRIGSVITDLELDITPRKYGELKEFCSSCGACIKRCPAGAISEKGKNDGLCSDFLDKTKEFFNPRYGCGKCQTKTPCETQVPRKNRAE